MSKLRIEHIIKALDKARLLFALALFIFIGILCSYKLIKGSIVPKPSFDATATEKASQDPHASFVRPLVLKEEDSQQISQLIYGKLENELQDEELTDNLQDAYDRFFEESFAKKPKDYGIDSKRLIQWSLQDPIISITNIKLPSSFQDAYAQVECDIALNDPSRIFSSLMRAANPEELTRTPSQGYFAYVFEDAIASGRDTKILHCIIPLKTYEGSWIIDESFQKHFAQQFKSDLIFA